MPVDVTVVYVLTQGVSVRGVFTDMDKLRAHLDPDVTLEPCPNPEGGWNSRWADGVRGPSVRVMTVDETPDQAKARSARWRAKTAARRE